MNRTTRLAIAVLAIVALQAGDAAAQLTLTSGPTARVGTTAGTTFTEAPGGEFKAQIIPPPIGLESTIILRLSGDGTFPITPASPNVQAAFPEGYAQFTVGPLPVRITPNYFMNFKVVNGGGTTGAPSNLIAGGGGVYESGTFNPLDGSGALGPNINSGSASDTLVGNGLIVFDDSGSLPSYILAVGVNYTFFTSISSNVNASGLPLGSPSSAVTIEAGGISNWSGVTLSVPYEVVPEPSAAAAALLLTAASLTFRRRPRRRTCR